MEFIAEHGGHVPVAELVRGALLSMADSEERDWRSKVDAFSAALRELELYKSRVYTAEEYEEIEADALDVLRSLVC